MLPTKSHHTLLSVCCVSVGMLSTGMLATATLPSCAMTVPIATPIAATFTVTVTAVAAVTAALQQTGVAVQQRSTAERCRPTGLHFPLDRTAACAGAAVAGAGAAVTGAGAFSLDNVADAQHQQELQNLQYRNPRVISIRKLL